MTKKQPGKGWWSFAGFLLLFFVLLQLPAAWILSRIAPQNPYIDSISGSIWQGQADWHMQNIQGVLSWQLRPLSILLLRIAADVDIQTGNTHLTGQAGIGFNQKRVDNLNGQIGSDTLATLLPWQWPTGPIQLHDLKLVNKGDAGWQTAEGQLNWAGGLLGYPLEGHIEHANLPPLVATLGAEDGRLQVDLTNTQHERMGNIYLTKDQMVEVQLTQRLLLTVASYHGQAGLDTAVVTTRQPLASLRTP